MTENMTDKSLPTDLKFWCVDPIVNIVSDLKKQSFLMWMFIGWGWLALLVMVSSLVSKLVSA